MNQDKCPVCGTFKVAGTEFCDHCGWEYRYYLTPLIGPFLEFEQRRLTTAKKKWVDRESLGQAPALGVSQMEYPVVAYSYGILVSYRGEECVSNMIFRNDPIEVVREWPMGKFQTQVDNQSNIPLSIYRNQSDEKIVQVDACEKIMRVVISLDATALKGTPIHLCWERGVDNILLLKASCLNRETVVRIG